MRYTEDQLRRAIKRSENWRQVNIRLGRSPAARTAALYQHAVDLGIDVSHLPSRRVQGYSDEALTEAVRTSSSWTQVAQTLGKTSANSVKAMRRHAERLQLDVSHLRAAQSGSAIRDRDAEILRLHIEEEISMPALGERYGISAERVRQIVRRQQREAEAAPAVSSA